MLRSFEADGYVAFPQFVGGDEMAELTANVDRFIKDVVPKLPEEHVFYEDKNDSQTLKQIQHMEEHDSWFQQLFLEGRFRQLAQHLLGGPVVPKNIQYFNSFRIIRGDLARASAAICRHETYYDIALSWFTKRCTNSVLPLVDNRNIGIVGASGYSFWGLVRHAKRMLMSSKLTIRPPD